MNVGGGVKNRTRCRSEETGRGVPNKAPGRFGCILAVDGILFQTVEVYMAHSQCTVRSINPLETSARVIHASYRRLCLKSSLAHYVWRTKTRQETYYALDNTSSTR